MPEMLIEDVDWSHLFHAYGVATDTPGYLRSLATDDTDAQEVALDHLIGAVLHQGTVYPATAPVLRIVSALVGREELRHRRHDGTPMLAGVLMWIDAVGESAGWHEAGDEPEAPTPTEEEIADCYRRMTDGDDDVWESEVNAYLWRRGIADLEAACELARSAVGPLLTDADSAVRLAAQDAYVRLAAIAVDGADLTAPLRAGLEASTDRDERSVLVLGIGALGADTTPWLTDPDVAVRTCAAMYLRESSEATAVLIDTLREPLAVDGWFRRRPSRFDAHVRFGLLAELLVRDVTLDEILPAVVPMIAAAARFSATFDWGPILLKAFPDVHITPGVRPDPPTDLTDAQRAVLRALVAADGAWDPTDGNARLARMRVGLPDVRDEVAALAR